MNTYSVRSDLLESLKEQEFRQAFNLENVYTSVCFQIRALREQRQMSQAGLGKASGMAQERISILEDPNAETKPTLNTLLRLADGLDVGLEVRFVPFSTVLERSVHTDMKKLEVLSFLDELPILEQRIQGDLRAWIALALLESNNIVIPGEKFRKAQEAQQKDQMAEALRETNPRAAPALPSGVPIPISPDTGGNRPYGASVGAIG